MLCVADEFLVFLPHARGHCKLLNLQALCSVFSDPRGAFLAHNVPPGTLTLTPIYRDENTVFDVIPAVREPL